MATFAPTQPLKDEIALPVVLVVVVVVVRAFFYRWYPSTERVLLVSVLVL